MPRLLVALVLPFATCGGQPDQQPLTADCSHPSIVYADGDADGHAPPDGAPRAFCLQAGAARLVAPTGWSFHRDDCDDSDARAHPNAPPLTVPRGAGGWDWDCDGRETLEIPESGAACKDVDGMCVVERLGKWIDTTPAGCGTTAPVLVECDPACLVVTELRTQGCR